MNFQKKILPWVFHHKWSNGSNGDTCRALNRDADYVLGNRSPYLPAGPPWTAWRAGGFQPPVPVCQEAAWQQCSHTPLRLLSNARGDDFSLPPDEPWHLLPCTRDAMGRRTSKTNCGQRRFCQKLLQPLPKAAATPCALPCPQQLSVDHVSGISDRTRTP